MDEARRRLADELLVASREHDAAQADRLDRFRNVEPETAEPYPGYLSDLVRTLAPRAVLAIDNVLSHAHELIEFSALIEGQPGLTQTVVPVGAGLRLAVRDDS